MTERKSKEFNIKMLSELSGVSMFRIRAWEKRYQAFTPRRTQGNQRIYSIDDLEKIMLIDRLITLGDSVGIVARLSLKELKTRVTRDVVVDLERRLTVTIPAAMREESREELLNRLQSFLLQFRLDLLLREFEKLFIFLPTQQLLFEVLLPFLRELGEAVQKKRLNVAHEHACSAVLKFLMYKRLHQKTVVPFKNAAHVLITSPPGEWHEFGLLSAALLCAEAGARFTYLGPNLPFSAQVEAMRALNADLLLLGVSAAYSDWPRLNQGIAYCLKLLNKKQKIWCSGDGAKNSDPRFKKIAHLESFYEYLQEHVMRGI